MTTLLITGATRGLGLAAAHAAAARGARVLVAGRSPETVRATAAAVGGELCGQVGALLERRLVAVAQAQPGCVGARGRHGERVHTATRFARITRSG